MRALRRLLGNAVSPFRRPALASAAIRLDDPEVSRDPYSWYDRLRSEGEVVHLPRHDFWLVLGYDAVREALVRSELFSNAPYADIDPTLLSADPPSHGPVRRLASRQFGGETLRRLQAVAGETARRQLERRLDIVADFARPVSRAVAAELIGFDPETAAAVGQAETGGLAQLFSALDAMADRSTLFEILGGSDGHALGPDGPRNLVRLFWLAATTTTERVIAHSVLVLLEDEPLQARLRSEPDVMPAFVEEVARLHAPEMLTRRVTTRSTVLGGVALPAGAPVQVCLAAANRDPSRFDSPSTLRLDRGPAAHFTFGSGIHHCIGAPLARRTVGAAISVLLDEAPVLRPVRPLAETDFIYEMSVRTPRVLEVSL